MDPMSRSLVMFIPNMKLLHAGTYKPLDQSDEFQLIVLSLFFILICLLRVEDVKVDSYSSKLYLSAYAGRLMQIESHRKTSRQIQSQ